jgi:hypothetical protein
LNATNFTQVSASPRILDVVHIQGAQKILERLAEQLSKVQKALGEYLERERNSFPRFYFVGDEDLLEILGNSKDLVRVQKHFKKMFAGENNTRFAHLLLNLPYNNFVFPRNHVDRARHREKPDHGFLLSRE